MDRRRKVSFRKYKEVPEISFQADTITLYESHVKETPKYKSIAEIKLQK